MKHIKKFNEAFELRDDIRKGIENRKEESDYRKKYPLSLQRSEIDINSTQGTYDELVVLCHDSDALSEYIKTNNPSKEAIAYGAGMLFRVCIRGSWSSIDKIGESYTDSFKVLMEYSPLVLPSNAKDLLVKWTAEYGRYDILSYLKDKGYLGKFDENDYDDLIKWVESSRKLNEEGKQNTIDYINSTK